MWEYFDNLCASCLIFIVSALLLTHDPAGHVLHYYTVELLPLELSPTGSLVVQGLNAMLLC